MTNSIVEDIQEHLKQFRAQKVGVPLNRLSVDDLSALSGCHVRQHSQESDYKRSWAKLAKSQRLNRLMQYMQKLSKDYNLDTNCQHQLKTLFYDGISSDILDRESVNYDMVNGVVVKIDGLKRDPSGAFYFDRGCDRTTSTHIQTIKKFTPVSVTRLSLAQRTPKAMVIKKKPIISLKSIEN